MKKSKRSEWTKLENVSKVFPSTTSEKDTKVFRFTCELYENVDPDILQKALDRTIEDFPIYRSVLRRGVFWYYFQRSNQRPLVEKEHLRLCAPIYYSHARTLLFRVQYFNKRITIEVYHSISDGTGALFFTQTLVHYYITYAHGDDKTLVHMKPSYQPSHSEKMSDGFEKYFKGQTFRSLATSKEKKEDKAKVYKIPGRRTENDEVSLVEGTLPMSLIKEEIRKYNTTVSVYLVAVLINSIHKARAKQQGDSSIVVSVPINLRQFYQSNTTRNFFSRMNIGYNFYREQTDDFQHILRVVEGEFKRGLDPDVQRKRMEKLLMLETNPVIRVVPLVLKDFILRIANIFENKTLTSSFSNMGNVVMPPGFEKYIRQFSICVSARKPQICLVTYNGKMVVSFTSPYVENEIQRRFFRHFVELGAEVEIVANLGGHSNETL